MTGTIPQGELDESSFSITTEQRPGAIVVTYRGELELLSLAPARIALDEFLVEGVPALVVDLSALEFIDSIGLGLLVRAHKKAWVLRTPFILVCPKDGPAHRLLALTGLLQALRVHPTLEEALADLEA
ncbi:MULTISPECIES: STAS domain-containing protein [Mumia]|nr:MULTISPECIES: STAS domain-containing protein [Mumia]